MQIQAHARKLTELMKSHTDKQTKVKYFQLLKKKHHNTMLNGVIMKTL